MAHGFCLCQEIARHERESGVTSYTEPRREAEGILRRLETEGVIRRGEPRWSGDIHQLGNLIEAGTWSRVVKHLKSMPDQPLHYVWYAATHAPPAEENFRPRP